MGGPRAVFESAVAAAARGGGGADRESASSACVLRGGSSLGGAAERTVRPQVRCGPPRAAPQVRCVSHHPLRAPSPRCAPLPAPVPVPVPVLGARARCPGGGQGRHQLSGAAEGGKEAPAGGAALRGARSAEAPAARFSAAPSPPSGAGLLLPGEDGLPPPPRPPPAPALSETEPAREQVCQALLCPVVGGGRPGWVGAWSSPGRGPPSLAFNSILCAVCIVPVTPDSGDRGASPVCCVTSGAGLCQGHYSCFLIHVREAPGSWQGSFWVRWHSLGV